MDQVGPSAHGSLQWPWGSSLGSLDHQKQSCHLKLVRNPQAVLPEALGGGSKGSFSMPPGNPPAWLSLRTSQNSRDCGQLRSLHLP